MSRAVLDGPGVLRRFSSTFTVTRYAAGTFVNGNYTGPSGSPVTPTPTGTVTNPNGAERKLLPDGVRVEDVIVLHTGQQLQVMDPDSSSSGDLIGYKGHQYRVFKVAPWDEHGRFWLSMAVRLNP